MDFTLMHQRSAVVNLLQRQAVRHKRIPKRFYHHRIFDHPRQLRAPFHAASAEPRQTRTGHSAGRTGFDFLPRPATPIIMLSPQPYDNIPALLASR